MSAGGDSYRREYLYAAIGFLGAIGLALVPDAKNYLALPDWVDFVGYFAVLICTLLGMWLVYRTGGADQKAVINILCYAGYDSYLRKISRSVRRSLHLSLDSRAYLGEEIFDKLGSFEADLLIFDIEHTKLLSELKTSNRLIPLKELQRYSDSLPNVEELLNVAIDRIVPRVGDEVYGFPLRLGTNAISYNKRFLGSHGNIRSLRELLFGDSDLTQRLYKEKRIGLWKRQSVLMGLVSLALGNVDPYRLSADQFKAVCDHVRMLKRGARRIYWGPKDYERLRDDLEEGEVWLVLGGGEWHVDSRGSPATSKHPSIGWVIPEEGALVWVESVGITENCIAKLVGTSLTVSDLVQLIRTHLVGINTQDLLSREHLYAACPVSYQDLLVPGEEKYHYLGYSGPKEITQNFEDGVFVFRSGPMSSPPKGIIGKPAWDRFWQDEFLDDPG